MIDKIISTNQKCLFSFIALFLFGLSSITQAQTSEFVSVIEVESVSSHVVERSLMRSGGHPRDGFDDMVVPLRLDLPYREIVDPQRYIPGSFSIGTTSNGHLRDSSLLPLFGEFHHILPAHRERDTHYGTEELVSVILDAARHVGTIFPGSQAAIGNMARREGGDLRWSVSHNNGRDADIAFYFIDEAGEHVEVQDLVSTNRRGNARNLPLQFDVPRNWAFVEGLLTSDSAQIQWIFIYNPLKQLLLDYAREIGADDAIIALAEETLHQPGDSSPHNDHFHLRIYCSREDRLDGCINTGPLRNNAIAWQDDLDLRVNELLRGLMDPEPEIASACASFLEALEPKESAFVIASSVPHQSFSVQLSLINLLARLDQPGVTGPLMPLAMSSPNAELRNKLFWFFGRLADPASAPWLARMIVLTDETLPDGSPLPLAAATALRNITVASTTSELIIGINDEREEVRAAIAHVLHRTTGVLSPVDPAGPLNEEEMEILLSFWTSWSAEHAEESRDCWLEDSFREAGYRVGDLTDDPNLPGLVAALDDEQDMIRFNADRQLNRHTRHWTPSENWTIDRRVNYWEERIE